MGADDTAEPFTYEERDLIQEVLGEHLEGVKNGTIIYGNKEDTIDTLKSILAKVA